MTSNVTVTDLTSFSGYGTCMAVFGTIGKKMGRDHDAEISKRVRTNQPALETYD